jgi:hypothetical protein
MIRMPSASDTFDPRHSGLEAFRSADPAAAA